MGKKVGYLILILLGLYGNTAHSAIAFYHYSSETGLIDPRINCITQDSAGFIWLAGEYSLSRFDGHEFKEYQSTIKEHRLWNKINTLFTDSDGMLWVGSDNGIYYYNILQDKFETPNNELNKYSVNQFSEGKNKQLWLATNNGLAGYNKKTGRLDWITGPRSVNIPDEKITGLINFSRVTVQSDSIIWCVKAENLFRINVKNGSFITAGEIDLNIDGFQLTHIEYSNGNLFLATVNNGILKFNTKKKTTKQFILAHVANSVHQFQIVSDSILWAATDNGLVRLNSMNGKYERYTNVPSDPLSMSRTAARFVLCDKENNLWVSNGMRGVDFGLNNIPFEHLIYSEDLPYTVSDKEVTAVDVDNEGNLWVGYESGKIEQNTYQPLAKNQYSLISPENGETPGSIFKIFEDSNNRVWAGGWSSGLFQLDTMQNKFVKAHIVPEPVAEKVKMADIRDIAEGPEGYLWVTLHGVGLGKYNPGNNSMKIYGFNEANPAAGLSNRYTYDLCFDNSKNLWISSAYGITKMDIHNEKFTTYAPHPEDSVTLSSDYIKTVHCDKSGTIWAGTDVGLNIFIPKLNKFQPIVIDHNVSFEQISAIESVEPGEIWVSTNSGLMHLTYTFTDENQKAAYNINYFYPSNGLISTIYFDRSSAQQGNIIYFGGNEGIDFFNAQRNPSAEFKPPKAVVTEISLYGNPIRPVMNNPEKIPQLVLSYDQKMVSFRFTSINFVNPQQEKFRYKLENFDEQWVYPQDERVATYTNLSKGDYTFIVEVSDKDGNWTQSELNTIAMKMKPPYWKTTPFVILVLLLTILLLYFAQRLRFSNLKQRQIKLQSLVDERTKELQIKNQELEKANRTKDKFFSIIAHDLRSPFSGLLGILEILNEPEITTSKKRDSLLKSAYDTAENTFGLLENLLVWARSQSKRIEYQPEFFNLSEILDKNMQLTTQQAQQKNIEVKGQFNKKVQVFADANMIDTVIRNVLNNAVKFTPKGGTVSLKTSERNSDVVITVTDTGVGLTPEQRKNLFDVNSGSKNGTNGEAGTGLGLVISKEFTIKNKGKIWASKNHPKGTAFHISMPTRKA